MAYLFLNIRKADENAMVNSSKTLYCNKCAKAIYGFFIYDHHAVVVIVVAALLFLLLLLLLLLFIVINYCIYLASYLSIIYI